MSKYWEKLKYALVDGKYITQEEFDDVVQSTSRLDKDPVQYLIEKQYLSPDLFGQAVAEAYGVAYADLNSYTPTNEQILAIPEDVAQKYRVVLFDEGKNDVTVTTDLPGQEKLGQILSEVFPDKKVHIAFSLEQDIDRALLSYQDPLNQRMRIIQETDDNPAPTLVEELFKEAVLYRASDIHIEPYDDTEVSIRYRVDGLLEDKAQIPHEIFGMILNRIKVLAGLRIDEHGSTQDGSIRYRVFNHDIDLRVSIAPTLYGEKIVIRVLSSYLGGLSIDNLGLDSEDRKVLEAAARKPFGMIINVGPTGSGKTTTLYSIMDLLNTPEVNITTIEDPVEYRVPGLNQIQVNAQKDLTFARGLRSIVRQDPDIILVGEVRDTDTAEIAINAALTGHRLLTTFHANDAATAIPRLLDMGVEPFLVSSTIELIIAQRLVRKICESCKHSVERNADEVRKELYGHTLGDGTQERVTLYEGKGCDLCQHTGYDGRTAIFEYIKITPEIRELILENPSSTDIRTAAQQSGSSSLYEDGIRKVQAGITTIEELNRVASPSEYAE